MSKTYRVTGNFQMGAQRAHFQADVGVATPEKAREKVLSDYGSRHHIGRRQIVIENVEEVKPEADERKGKTA